MSRGVFTFLPHKPSHTWHFLRPGIFSSAKLELSASNFISSGGILKVKKGEIKTFSLRKTKNLVPNRLAKCLQTEKQEENVVHHKGKRNEI